MLTYFRYIFDATGLLACRDTACRVVSIISTGPHTPTHTRFPGRQRVAQDET